MAADGASAAKPRPGSAMERLWQRRREYYPAAAPAAQMSSPWSARAGSEAPRNHRATKAGAASATASAVEITLIRGAGRAGPGDPG